MNSSEFFTIFEIPVRCAKCKKAITLTKREKVRDGMYVFEWHCRKCKRAGMAEVKVEVWLIGGE